MLRKSGGRQDRWWWDGLVAASTLAALLAASGCAAPASEDQERPGGLAIPEGAAVRKSSAAGRAVRSHRAAVSRLASYGSDLGWEDEGPSTLHVAVLDGRVFVLSGVHSRIEEFTPDGAAVAVWDGRAQGQLFGAIGMAVLDTRIIVADVAAERLSVWNPDGELVGEASSGEISRINYVIGVNEEGLVVSKVLLTQDDEQQTVSAVTEDGEEVERYAILPIDRNLGEQTVWPRPRAVVGQGGRVYASTAETYRVHAFRPDGALEYVIDVDWPRQPVSESARRTVERTRRAGRALGANVRDREELTEIPDLLPALENLEVDGRGRLYVFPLTESHEEGYPVDVYSPEGERLKATWLPFQSWEAQSRDDIYRIETVPETGATIVVRYRLDLTLD